MNDFPLIELNEEALKENAMSLLGNDYSFQKEKELLDFYFENERIINHWKISDNTVEQILKGFDRILDMHGVESLYDQENPVFENNNILYCNSGDTYTQTIICFNNSFYIGDWGSLVEWLENRYQEENENEIDEN